MDGPLTDDTITYTYDELGRVVSRAINGAANTTTRVYDALGRVTSETNTLGTFTYAYVGATGRLQLVTYPNGQTSSYAYYDNLNDQRLQTIHHRKPDTTTLSKFDYTYDVAGNILTWLFKGGLNEPGRVIGDAARPGGLVSTGVVTLQNTQFTVPSSHVRVARHAVGPLP